MTTNEEGIPPSHISTKQMRRIEERADVPVDKAELITFLSQRISQAEDALSDTQELLESESQERLKITLMVDNRNLQLQQLCQLDEQGLPQKIKTKLTEILSLTIGQKVEAEQNLGTQRNRNHEFKQMYQQLKWQQKNIGNRLDQQKRRQDDLSADVSTIEQRNTKHEEEVSILQGSLNELKDKKNHLEDQYLQMKIARERMNDIRAVLNRFFGNEDLFDQKMELREQKVQRIQVISRQNQPRPSSKEATSMNKLKPLVKTQKNSDEDFWKGDFSKNRK